MRIRGWETAKKFLKILPIFLSLSVFATTVVPMKFNDLDRESSIIVYGKVVQLDVNPQGFRSAVVEALEVVRAPQALKTERDFIVPLLNRAVPRSDLVDVVPMAPELRPSEEVLLFLEALRPEDAGPYARLDGRPLFTLKGFYQGKLRVFADGQGVRRAAMWNEVPEVKLPPIELKSQKTTTRMGLRALTSPELLPDAASLARLPALDGVLNRLRERTEAERR